MESRAQKQLIGGGITVIQLVDCLENVLGSYNGLPPNVPHRRHTARRPAPPLQASLFLLPFGYDEAAHAQF